MQKKITRLFILLVFVSVATTALSQAPLRFNYQAVARNSAGNVLVNQSISIRLSVLDGSPFGTLVYAEEQQTTTNQFGLFTVAFGTGSVVTGNFSSVAWGTGNKYLKTEFDPAGGAAYISMGTTELLSVPFAMYAQTSGGAGNGWNIAGNSGTNPAANFIGTTDLKAFRFRVNDIFSGELNPVTYNTAFGIQALASNTTGYSNVALGIHALRNNTAGHNMVAIGDSALFNQTLDPGGNYANTAVGSKALYANTMGSHNTGLGRHTLQNNTTGSENTAIGSAALTSNISGNSNTAIGSFALVTNTGSYNTASGAASLEANKSGSKNTASGYQALWNNATGNNNTAAGYFALLANSTGYSNVAIGANALNNNSVGFNMVAVGDSALYHQGVNATGYYFNTAVGSKALFFNNIGYANTATGYQALFANTTGNLNTANGSSALSATTTGSNNTGTGAGALGFNVGGSGNTATGAGTLSQNNGDNNTADGLYALNNNRDGIGNVASGYQALSNNMSGVYNVATGSNSLYGNSYGDLNTADGYSALYAATGSYNTGIGGSALNNLTSGSFNTALGYLADVSAANGAATNATAIGFGAKVNASNKIRLGNSAVTVIEGQVALSFPSDGRFKINVTETVKGLDFINRLRPVVYNFESKKYNDFLEKDNLVKNVSSVDYTESEHQRQSGFIAQEVETAARASGYDFNGIIAPKNDRQAYSLSYSQFVVPLVKAVQEQQLQIEELKKQVEELKKIVAGTVHAAGK